jgi:hypothetical protein
MRIYYHEYAAVTTQKFIDFNITTKGTQFNNITTHRSASPLKNLILPTIPAQTPPATSSGLLAGAGYIQDVTGLTVKLTFPYLSAIGFRQDYLRILRADLTVRPVPGSFSTQWTLPPHIGINLTNQNNISMSALPSSTTGGLQNGSLVVDYLHPLSTVYTYDVTHFISAQIKNTAVDAGSQGLMLSIPTPASETSFSRAVIADQSYPVNQRTTLTLYYISLYPHQ